MPEYSKHIDTFPLEHLFRRLELAGFRLSPADRLRALRILGGPAKAYLDQPAQLKQLLAPVLVRSEAEQLKFYEIFDQYYLEMSSPWEPPALDEEKVEWWKWLFLLPMLAILFYAYYALTQHEVGQEELTVYIEGPKSGIPGDTVRFENKTSFPDERGQWKWRWSYIDIASQQEELSDTSSQNWEFIIPGIDSGAYLREVRLQVWPPDLDTTYETQILFAVFCPNAPTVAGIQANTQLEAEQKETFQAIIPEEAQTAAENWLYEWDYGDGLQDEGSPETTHSYSQNGQYSVVLTVTDTTANGFCSTTQTLDVKVGREQAFLPTANLRHDRLSLLATWGWGFYILLAALGLGLLYYWLRWLTRKKRRPIGDLLQQQKKEALNARFAHSDKAPYFIPLRDQNSFITTARIQHRLADALRLRQEGLRKELDLHGTLHTTIEKGGFPAIQYQYATQPSEYLCLIDEQSRASHLGHLFRYLADDLKGQDVHLEVYYYRQHFNRFWNSYYPQGRTLDQLQRAYGSYRLLVMGDLHDLLNPYARKSPNLRSAYANVLRQWPLRLLLTPVPPVSWSYREKLLARIFSVFPIDSFGLAGAALHIENDGELLPDGSAYDRWQAAQTSIRQDSDTEHRNWRRWRFIEEYLRAYDEDLVRWFRALAVFPIPSWEMTIAIGRALGVNISYDNLLRLARIPVLQGDRFDERLRREMLADLSPLDERKARAAVQQELAAVRLVSEGSHAHRDLESALAVQEFALAPLDEKHQQTLRYMLQHDLLTPAQEADLERIVNQRASAPAQKMAQKASPPQVSLREWLDDNWNDEIEEDLTPREEDRTDLRRAIWLTAAYLVLLLIGWQLGGSDQLYQLVFSEPLNQGEVADDRPLRNYFFVQETEVIDSAIIYNNLGVDQAAIATLGDTTAAPSFRNAIRTASSFLHSYGESFNGERISYSLANANLSKLYLNAAVQELNGYLSDSLGQAVLPEALELLETAYRSDSTLLDIWHTRGVIHYYAGSPEDSSLYYYNLLDSLDYFQTLSYSPNLETLIGRERSRIVEITPTDIGDRVLRVTVNYYVDPTIYPGGAELILTAIGTGAQPTTVSQEINAGRSAVDLRLEPPLKRPGELEQLSLSLMDPSAERLIQTLELPFAHNWKQSTRIIERPPLQQIRARAFRLEGEVIDATTRVPVSGFVVMLQQKLNRVTRSPKQFNGQLGKYGDFYIEGELLPQDDIDVFDLIIDAPGYKRYQQEVYTQKDLLGSNPFVLSSPIRLEKDTPRPRMELISGGGFLMGDETGEYDENELPTHEVTLDNFYMGIFEVTFAEYDLFCEATDRPKPDDNGWGRGKRPVINVSWLDAVEYCNWLSIQHGYQPVYNINQKVGSAELYSTRGGIPNGYRLPFEAEWEYAARGGILMNKSHIYAGSSELSTVGWYDRNSNDQTHPVGQLRPNNAGTFDMSGNVWEWCYDYFGSYTPEAKRNPTGPDYSSHRIVRGGAWMQQDMDCRVTTRQYRRASEKAIFLGFRLVRRQ